MAEIPKLQKKISAFLVKEEGKISKEKILKAGILLGAVALASVKTANASCPPAPPTNGEDHCNNLGITYNSGTATGTHEHEHGSHSSHSSHGSHGSHGQW